MHAREKGLSDRPPFKLVCEDCGSLSIKVAVSSTSFPGDAIVQCGRCTAVRGTLADFHALARSHHDFLEF